MFPSLAGPSRTLGSPVSAGEDLVEWMGRKFIAFTTKMASDSFAEITQERG